MAFNIKWIRKNVYAFQDELLGATSFLRINFLMDLKKVIARYGYFFLNIYIKKSCNHPNKGYCLAINL